jgi:imidazolonepropionase-like amidohydrolase
VNPWTKGIVVALLAAFLVAASGGCASPRLPTGPYALVDLTLIDGTGAEPRPDAVVLVKAGRIEAVGAEVPAGYERVSLNGARLLPGFINAHVHSWYDAATLARWLSAGVTSVRDLGPRDASEFLATRDRLNADPRYARLIAATPLITKPGGYGSAYVDGPQDARELVRRFIAQGVDVVKVAIEDDLQGRRWPLLSQAEVRAVVAEAHAGGRRVSAHISHVSLLPIAINAGVDDLAHMVVEPLPAETARAIVARGIAWVPTLELWKGVSAKHSLDWDRVAIANTAVFHEAGGTIALGTDFNGYTIPFDKGFPITEARLLMEAGLSAMEVIVAGTRNAALVSGRLGDLGTIEAGKTADMLVVADDPLEHIGALEHPTLVIKGGAAVRP